MVSRHLLILTLLIQENPRTKSLLIVAKANNLKIDLIDTRPHEKPVSDDYRKLNKLGRIPTFEGSDGYILSECIAIAIYREFLFLIVHAFTALYDILLL